MQLINSRCRTGEWTAKSFHRFQSYSFSDILCCTVSHIAEFRSRFITCLCALKRFNHQLFLIKALQSQLHLDAEKTDFSARHLPFARSIHSRFCLLRKGSLFQNPLKTSHSFLCYHICMSDGESILEHRQEDFVLIIFIQNFSIPCQGLYSSPSLKLQSNLLKLHTQVTKKRSLMYMKLTLQF